MSEIWTVINEALVILVVALIGLVAWKLRGWLQLKVDGQHLQVVNWVALMAVQAAEQYGGSGEEKKREAVALAEKWLEERGIYLDLNVLDAAIEAAVFAELNHFAQMRRAAGRE